MNIRKEIEKMFTDSGHDLKHSYSSAELCDSCVDTAIDYAHQYGSNITYLFNMMKWYRKNVEGAYFLLTINKRDKWDISMPNADYKLHFESHDLEDVLKQAVGWIRKHVKNNVKAKKLTVVQYYEE